MDFLKSLGDIFKRETVPMQQNPSIVKLGEGEEIVLDRPEPPAMTHGPTGMFGDTYGGGDMPSPDQMPATPQETMDQHREDYAFPNPLVMQEQLADAQRPNGPEIPSIDEAPSVPAIAPEQNETITDMIQEEGVPVPEGYEKYTDEQGRVRLREVTDVPAPDEDYDYARRGRQGWKVVGEESQEEPLTQEEAAAVDEAVSGMPTAPDPDSVDNVDTVAPRPIRTPDGNSRSVTREDVEQVAQEDPSGFSKAMSWITKTFGVTGQDLARFAALYAGSRLAGYDHQGSLGWSFEVAGTDLVERRELHTRMAATGNFTMDSMEEFRKTGDFSVVKKAPDPTKGVKVDFTSPKYTADGKDLVYPATLPDGSKVHVTKGGQRYDGVTKDPEEPETNREIYEEYIPTVSAIARDYTDPGKDPKTGKPNKEWYTGSEDADAARATEFALAWALENGVPPNSAAFADITAGAWEQARRWAQASGKEVGSIQPFLDQQRVYITSNDAWAGALTDKDGQKLDVEKFGQLSNSVMRILEQDPAFPEAAARADKGTMLSWAMKALYDDYEALPPEQRGPYEKQGGFYAYLQEATLNPFDN